MPKDTENFERIMAGLEDAAAFMAGETAHAPFRVHVPTDVNVRAIRQHLNLTQAEFAARFGFPVATVRDWEQGRRHPEASARILLTVIEREPEAVERALAAVA